MDVKEKSAYVNYSVHLQKRKFLFKTVIVYF